MVQARRAKVRPVRVIIPLVVAAALLVGGSFAAWKFWPETTTAGPQAESSATAVESQAPSTAVSSPSPSDSSSATAEPASAAAKEALEACQKKVDAADEVRKQGETGVSALGGSRPSPDRQLQRQDHLGGAEGAVQEDQAEGPR